MPDPHQDLRQMHTAVAHAHARMPSHPPAYPGRRAPARGPQSHIAIARDISGHGHGAGRRAYGAARQGRATGRADHEDADALSRYQPTAGAHQANQAIRQGAKGKAVARTQPGHMHLQAERAGRCHSQGETGEMRTPTHMYKEPVEVPITILRIRRGHGKVAEGARSTFFYAANRGRALRN